MTEGKTLKELVFNWALLAFVIYVCFFVESINIKFFVIFLFLIGLDLKITKHKKS